MGDRGNIAIVDQGKRVYLYTHWRGSDIQDITRTALARRLRWDDPPYLARIVFCTLMGDDVTGETGCGISTEIGDNSHLIVVIDCDVQAVRLEDESGKPRGDDIPFADYIKG